MSEKITAFKRLRTNIYQKSANLLCWGRIGVSPFVAEHAVSSENPRTWAFGGLIALIGATDKLDGVLSRQAAKLSGQATTERGAWLDQLSDKVFVHGALGGLAVNAMMHGRPVFGGICAANQAVMMTRDIWVTRERKQAAAVGVPTLAKRLGKIKTALQITAVSMAASPITNIGETAVMNGGEFLTAGAITSATVLSVASGVSLVRNMREQQPPLRAPLTDPATA